MTQIGSLATFSSGPVMKSADMDSNYAACLAAHNGARQPFLGSLNDNVNTSGCPGSSTKYARFGSSFFQTTEHGIPIPVATTLSLLTVRLDGSQPADGSLVVTVRKNGVDTALTVTVSAAAGAGTYQDATHSVAFAAGDTYSLSIVNNGTTASPIRSYSFLGDLLQLGPLVSFAPSTRINAQDINTNNTAWKAAHEGARYLVLSSGTGTYSGPGNAGSRANVNEAEWVTPVAGTLDNFYINDSTGSPRDATIYVNGVATALTVLSAATGVTGDTTHSVTVAAGDRIAVGTTTGYEAFGFCFRPATVGALVTHTAGTPRSSADVNANFAAFKAAHNAERIPTFVWNQGHVVNQISAGATVFVSPSMTGTPVSTESQAECVVPVATTFRSLVVLLGWGLPTDQPGTGSLVFTVRKNGADTALTVTFAAGAAHQSEQSDLTHSVAFAAGDRICLKAVNNAASDSAYLGAASMTADL